MLSRCACLMINPSREKGMNQRIRHLMRLRWAFVEERWVETHGNEKYQRREPGSAGREKTLTEKAPPSISRQRYHGSGVADVEIMKGAAVCGLWVWVGDRYGTKQKASPKESSRAGDGRERHSVHVTGLQKKRSE